ncbi:hypothetical protein B0H16DRAFT_1469563 [Mycena metata]|uniref:Uncharacterized protein n=1 Tax=Mycena metata TaxID=1033252 RepID=A0AAD7HYQ1_9AGAR|nr:hypothetical protein B0H16DRAFT_1469563 [Mycena metata]
MDLHLANAPHPLSLIQTPAAHQGMNVGATRRHRCPCSGLQASDLPHIPKGLQMVWEQSQPKFVGKLQKENMGGEKGGRTDATYNLCAAKTGEGSATGRCLRRASRDEGGASGDGDMVGGDKRRQRHRDGGVWRAGRTSSPRQAVRGWQWAGRRAGVVGERRVFYNEPGREHGPEMAGSSVPRARPVQAVRVRPDNDSWENGVCPTLLTVVLSNVGLEKIRKEWGGGDRGNKLTGQKTFAENKLGGREHRMLHGEKGVSQGLSPKSKFKTKHLRGWTEDWMGLGNRCRLSSGMKDLRVKTEAVDGPREVKARRGIEVREAGVGIPGSGMLTPPRILTRLPLRGTRRRVNGVHSRLPVSCYRSAKFCSIPPPGLGENAAARNDAAVVKRRRGIAAAVLQRRNYGSNRLLQCRNYACMASVCVQSQDNSARPVVNVDSGSQA